MIRCQKVHLQIRATERGYTFDEVAPCIVERHEDGTITVDENHKAYPRKKQGLGDILVDHDHPAYPRQPKPGFTPKTPEPPPTHGPGTELKKLLKKVGITASPNCSCNARARTMDQWGCDKCEERIDEIVGWLREEATKRRLPFVDAVGRMIVKRAIKMARKSALDAA